MTELATPPTEQRAGLTRISHWIGGKPVEGASGRTGPVFNPALGQQSGEVDLATTEEVGAAVAAAKAAFPAWRATSLAKRAELMFRIRELVHDRREEVGADPHRRARQGALRRDGRGHARARGDRVRLRDPAPAQGRDDRAGLDRDRRLLDPAAARRRGRDHAVQLPGDGADVDVGAGARVREHVRAQALREGSVRVGLDGGAAEGGGRPRRRLQRRPRRQGRGRRDPRAPGRGRGQLRRLDADRALHLRDRDEARQARAGARRGEEPHDRPSRRRHRPGRRRGRERRLRLGRRALHGDLAGGHRRRRRRQARRGDQAAAAEDQGRQRPRGRRRDGPARHARAPRQGRLLHRGRRRAGRDGRRRRPRDRAGGRRLLPRRHAAGRRHARDGRLQGRDLRPGARRHARRDLRRGGRSS